MTEQYEYERVEIKPEDQRWVGKQIYTATDNLPYTILCVGKVEVFLRIEGVGWNESTIGQEHLWSIKKTYYIRKPKRKMVKVAQCLFKVTNLDGTADYFPNGKLLTEEEARQRFGFYRWPYGPTFEVEEGE